LTQSTLNSLEQDEIDGELRLPGVVADVVAKKGQFASIYGWTGDKTLVIRARQAGRTGTRCRPRASWMRCRMPMA
jgi:hypothetical protein